MRRGSRLCRWAGQKARRIAREGWTACKQLERKAPHAPDESRRVLAGERAACDREIVAENALWGQNGAASVVRSPSVQEDYILSRAHKQNVRGVQVGALPLAAALQRLQNSQKQARHVRIGPRPR